MLVPFRPFDTIEKEAAQFLERYNPDGVVPVPIEEIVEFELGIEIMPLPGLRDRADVEGFISSGLRMLYVDEQVMTRFPARYRFTLAHEVAHKVLHADYINSSGVQTPEEWRNVTASRPAEDHRRLEIQANEFAGRVLVPTARLADQVDRTLEALVGQGIVPAALSYAAVEMVCRTIGTVFLVS